MSSITYYVEVNTICILISVLILIGMAKVKKLLRDKIYIGLVIATMAMCTGELFAGLFRGMMFKGARTILWASNMTYFVSTYVMCVLWVMYSLVILTGKINRKIATSAIVIAIIGVLIVFTTPFTKCLFTIDEKNLYSRGPYIWVHWVVLFPCMVLPSILAPFTKAGKRERRAITSFVFLPLLSMVVQVLFYGLSISQVGVTMAYLFVYITLQSQLVNEAETRAQIYNEMSSTDSLTGLRNRRAYERRLEVLEKDGWIGVVFADLNGLKKENDTNGHTSGDHMLVNFADFLRGYFDEDEIYRISGDEFVILSNKESDFEEACAKLREDVRDRASLGFSIGPGENAYTVVGKAEEAMYSDKAEYYKRTGIERRHF